MGEEQKKQLETQLWNIANELRGKMDADEFRDYMISFSTLLFYSFVFINAYDGITGLLNWK
jgi:type I restriction enzyme M protein